MTIKTIYFTAILGLAIFSCQSHDSITELSQDEIFRQTNIFPQPPNQWMGENNPYYTAGYVGDVMPYYENGKFHLPNGLHSNGVLRSMAGCKCLIDTKTMENQESRSLNAGDKVGAILL